MYKISANLVHRELRNATFEGEKMPTSIRMPDSGSVTGFNDVSWHNRDIISPNMEKLAKDGVILESAYMQPMCTASRSALLTGYYPIHTGRQVQRLHQVA